MVLTKTNTRVTIIYPNLVYWYISPTNRYANARGEVGSIMYSLTQSIHFLSYLVSQNQIFQYPLLISTAKTVRRNANCVK